jgi:hypothetical protein
MKKLFTILALLTLVACGNDQPPQVQYQQPPVVQQAPAPAQAPVVVQQSDNTGTALVAGAALGAVATMALTDRDRGAHPVYDNRPTVQQNVTHVTQVNKTVIVNNHAADAKTTPPAAATPASAPAPTPLTPAPAAVKPSYAAPGTVSPTPTMTASALTAPKTVTIPTSPTPAANYKPSAYTAVAYKQPAPRVSLAKPIALPAPKPSPSYGYKAPSYKK